MCAFFIPKELDGDSRVVDMNFTKRIKFNMGLVKNGIKLRQVWQTLVFYLIMAFLTPSFKDFLDYYYNFQSIKDGSVEMAFCVGVLISTICFHMFLKDTEIRKLMIIAIIFNIVNCVLNVCLALDIMFGLTLFQFVVIQSFLFDSIYQAFSFLPVYVVFTKLVPY